MTSFRLASGAVGAAVAGLLVLPSCIIVGGDDTDTMAGTTNATGVATGMDDNSVTSADSTGSSSDLSHSVDIQPIWDEHCTMVCHEPGGEWEFLDMAPGTAYGEIVGVMSTQATDLAFVEPGDVEASYLWHKINATQADAGGGGLDMPKPRGTEMATVMTQGQLDTIRAWIEAGAPE